MEKSLGAAAKGGTTPLNAVYKYAEPVVSKGFVFMDTPGYDPVSATGQVAGGANILAFTTGRGSLDGVSIEDKGKEIFDMILAVASGARTKSEQLGYGEAEFTPWQIGATM